MSLLRFAILLPFRLLLRSLLLLLVGVAGIVGFEMMPARAKAIVNVTVVQPIVAFVHRRLEAFVVTHPAGTADSSSKPGPVEPLTPARREPGALLRAPAPATESAAGPASAEAPEVPNDPRWQRYLESRARVLKYLERWRTHP